MTVFRHIHGNPPRRGSEDPSVPFLSTGVAPDTVQGRDTTNSSFRPFEGVGTSIHTVNDRSRDFPSRQTKNMTLVSFLGSCKGNVNPLRDDGRVSSLRRIV